jgi:hypothetical protein
MKRGVLLLVIILVLAGGIGWYVWGKNKDDNSTAKTNQSASAQSKSDYIAIKEWGIRFKLPEDLKNDINYKYDSTVNVIRFGSKKYAAIQPYCASEQIGVGALYRSSTQESIPSTFKNFKNIDGYFYYSPSAYSSGNGSCNKNGILSDAQLRNEGKLEQELFNSFSSISAE